MKASSRLSVKGFDRAANAPNGFLDPTPRTGKIQSHKIAIAEFRARRHTNPRVFEKNRRIVEPEPGRRSAHTGLEWVEGADLWAIRLLIKDWRM